MVCEDVAFAMAWMLVDYTVRRKRDALLSPEGGAAPRTRLPSGEIPGGRRTDRVQLILARWPRRCSALAWGL